MNCPERDRRNPYVGAILIKSILIILSDIILEERYPERSGKISDLLEEKNTAIDLEIKER